MNAVIERVIPEPRKWADSAKYPDGCSVEGIFQDGTRFELATKTGKANEHIAALQALVGKPGEFEVEEREFNGQKQFRMKSYPGKAEGKFGGGGGKQYVPSWHQTEEGERYTQERMDRRTSLMQAVATGHVDGRTDGVLDMATYFYDWLRATDQKPVQPAPQPIGAPPQSQTGKWMGPGRSPCCDCVPNSVHKPTCTGAPQ